MFGFGGNKNGRSAGGVEKPMPSHHEEEPDVNANLDEMVDQSNKTLADVVALHQDVKELHEKIKQDDLPDSIKNITATTMLNKQAKETQDEVKRITNDKGTGGITATAERAGAVERGRACKYCGKPVVAGANRKGGKHDICSKEYRQRDKNGLCVYCGDKHGIQQKKCSKYENYGTPRLVMRKCEYCHEPVNPTLNEDKKHHDECYAEWKRRMDNDLCWHCGEEILDSKAEGSEYTHRKCKKYERFVARDQSLCVLTGGSQTGSTAIPGAGPRERPQPLSYDNVGGLDKELKKLREAIELPLLHPAMFTDAGISAPKGILLYGQPGTGKTLLAKTIAAQAGVNFTYVAAPSLLGRWVGDTERWTRKIFKDAIANSPAVIFIDEIDVLGKDRVDADRNYQIDMTEQLLASMDHIGDQQVVVIGATNRPHALDPAFRRPGRFDVEIEFGMPDEKGRHDILKIHTRGVPLDRVNLKKIAGLTHGFTGADIMAVVREAGMSAIRNAIRNGSNGSKPSGKRKVRITGMDFEKAMNAVRPSMLRATECAVPDIGWDDIGGLDYVRDTIMEDIEWPRKHPKEYARMGIQTSRGILLHGPPGTGKTMIAKAVANGTDSNFITVGCPELISKRPGDTEKNIKNLFAKARRAKPCVIFFDEIDALLPERRYGIDNNRIVSQILIELDGVGKSDGVILIGATNMLDMIDKAALRPGRFDKIIEIKPPGMEGRRSIMEVHVGKRPHNDMDLKRLAAMADGFTGADIAHAVNAASAALLRRHIESKSKDVANLTLTQEAVEASVLAARQKLNMPPLNYVLGINAARQRELQGTDRVRDADGK